MSNSKKQKMTDIPFNIAETLERGIAFVANQQLTQADACFIEAMTNEPRLHKSYIWHGVTQWLQGNPDQARDAWIRSLNCSYQDPAMMEAPLLLHALAVMYPQTHSRVESTKLLDERLMSVRAKSWPGPVVAYILGKMSESVARQLVNNESGKRRDSAECMCEFGTGLYHYDCGEFEVAGNAWRRCVSSSPSRYHFSHIAKYELSHRSELFDLRS